MVARGDASELGYPRIMLLLVPNLGMGYSFLFGNKPGYKHIQLYIRGTRRVDKPEL